MKKCVICTINSKLKETLYPKLKEAYTKTIFFLEFCYKSKNVLKFPIKNRNSSKEEFISAFENFL